MATSRTERTRAALQSAALDLFERQGYDATTTAQVAARAGVTEMTLFRHFTTKSALVLEDPYDPVIADAVVATDPGLPPAVRVAHGLRRAFAVLAAELAADDVDAMRRRLSIAAVTPSLRPGTTAGTTATAVAIAERMVATGVDPTAARVASVGVLAGVTEALLMWAVAREHGAPTDLVDALGAACDVMAGQA